MCNQKFKVVTILPNQLNMASLTHCFKETELFYYLHISHFKGTGQLLMNQEMDVVLHTFSSTVRMVHG